MQLAIFFPGIVYPTAKPLLYYSRMLAKQLGYETINIHYDDLPKDVKGSPERMKLAFTCAMEQTEQQLQAVDFSAYESCIFVSKSVGTAVAAAYAGQHRLHSKQVYYTPVEASFSFMEPGGIVFTGTSDPWVETAVVELNCNRLGLPLTILPNANHSLETGDVLQNLAYLQKVMNETMNYMKGD